MITVLQASNASVGVVHHAPGQNQEPPLNTMAWFLEKAGYTAKPIFALTIQEISRSTR